MALAGAPFTVDEDGKLSVNGTEIGTITLEGDTITLDLTSGATAALIQQVLRGIQIVVPGDNPSSADRTVTYTLTDGDGGTSTLATATIKVTPTNDLTDAKNDTATTDEATTQVIDVLGNDVDPDGPGKQVTMVDGQAIVAGGTVTLKGSGAKVTLNLDGTLTYDPNGVFDKLTGAASGGTNLSDTDSFSYTEADGDTATVTVTVNGLVSQGDDIVGNSGDNSFTVTDLDDNVVELPNGGTDTVTTDQGLRGPPYTSLFVLAANVENLIGTNANGQGVQGNAEDNVFTMAGGNDLVVLTGGGEDEVNGGGGNDYVFVSDTWSAGDKIDGGAGNDTVGFLNEPTIAFGAESLSGVEQLAFYGLSTSGAGWPLSYSVTMDDGNVAAGRSLRVTALSLGSDETLTFDGSAETDGSFSVLSGAGSDSITGGAGRDYLAGGGGDDTLNGGLENDHLVGGAGADTLTGGGGKDVFGFLSVAHSTTGSIDTITDFGVGLDRIDLSKIDANSATAANDAFTFIGQTAFNGIAGELRVVNNGGDWFVEGDVDGNGAADLIIRIGNGASHTFLVSDFVL
jgi:Ca2+-binding RTX toxin-like protein